jgi:hypothetical protein
LFVLLVYPLVNESSNSSCHALEKKAFSLITKRASQNSGDQITGLFGGAVLAELTNGELAGAYIKQVYPSIPPFIGCTIAYWKILTNPTALEDLLRPLQNSGLHL